MGSVARPSVYSRAVTRKASQTGEGHRRRIARETSAILDDAATILRAEGVEAKLFSRIGSPTDVIVKLAESYDVTVVGAACRNHPAFAGLGSVASRVAEHAAGLVLVARQLSSSFGLLQVQQDDLPYQATPGVQSFDLCGYGRR